MTLFPLSICLITCLFWDSLDVIIDFDIDHMQSVYVASLSAVSSCILRCVQFMTLFFAELAHKPSQPNINLFVWCEFLSMCCWWIIKLRWDLFQTWLLLNYYQISTNSPFKIIKVDHHVIIIMVLVSLWVHTSVGINSIGCDTHTHTYKFHKLWSKLNWICSDL